MAWTDKHRATPGFVHRVGDQFVESICLKCYRIVGATSESQPAALEIAERAHDCKVICIDDCRAASLYKGPKIRFITRKL